MADAKISYAIRAILQTLLVDRFPETVHQRARNKFIATLMTINDLLTDAEDHITTKTVEVTDAEERITTKTMEVTDAEEHITTKNVEDWFDYVQDALSQAEDLLDEIHYEDRRLQVESGSRSRSNKIQNLFSSLGTYNKRDNIKVMVQKFKAKIRKIKTSEKIGRKFVKMLEEKDPKFDLSIHGRDGILLDMKSSYREFPSDLRRCLVYCAVFPKGYYFRKEELVLLWLANGFLDFPNLSYCSSKLSDLFSDFPPSFSIPKKKLGYHYFEYLVQNKFFEEVRDHPHCFKLPDLIHEWAKSISGNYCVSLDDGSSLPRTTRHIWCPSSIRRYEDLANLMTNTHHDYGDRMRTILPISNESFWKDINDEELGKRLSTFKRLRVLWLPSIHKLPDCTMKHLRYLNLSGAAVERLPESVCRWFNLHTLILRQCRNLVELPADIVKLTELCHLDITETRLQQMPPHIGKLRKLETLTDFFVGEQTGCRIDELAELRHLQGELHIWNLQNVSDVLEVMFVNCSSFKELELRWSGSGADDSLLQHDVLKELRADTDVERLSIIGYGGKKFPPWIGDSRFSEIVDLKLGECQYCSFLPPLGQLRSLKTLVIQAFYRVEKVGSEFYGSSTFTGIPFPSLKTLTFERLLQWREWEDEGRAFPCLEALCIRKCPNLANKTLPIHPPSLVELEITKCQRLELPLSGLPPIDKIVSGDDFHKMVLVHRPQSLVVDSFHSLDSILEEIKQWGYSCSTFQKIEITRSPLETLHLQLFSELEELHISRCPNLKSLRTRRLASLKTLELTECPNLNSMPEKTVRSSLKTLCITSCPLLTRRFQRDTGKDWPEISHIPDLCIN